MESKIPTRDVTITHSDALGYIVRVYGGTTGALIKEFSAASVELPDNERFDGDQLDLDDVGSVTYSDDYECITVNLA